MFQQTKSENDSEIMARMEKRFKVAKLDLDAKIIQIQCPKQPLAEQMDSLQAQDTIRYAIRKAQEGGLVDPALKYSQVVFLDKQGVSRVCLNEGQGLEPTLQVELHSNGSANGSFIGDVY